MCFIVNPTIQLNTVQHNVNHTRKVRFVMLKGKSCTYKKYITDTSCARSSYGYTYGAYMRNLGWSLTECHELPKHILRRTWVKERIHALFEFQHLILNVPLLFLQLRFHSENGRLLFCVTLFPSLRSLFFVVFWRIVKCAQIRFDVDRAFMRLMCHTS